MSYRLGLIDAGFEHALQLVRKIRNDFAHQLDEESLSSQRQKPRLVELVRWANKSKTFESAVGLFAKTEKSTEHLQFTACISCMVIKLMGGLRNMQKINISKSLGHDRQLPREHVLLTGSQYIEASIRNYLNRADLFGDMHFILEVRGTELQLTRLATMQSDKQNVWRYPFSIPENGKVSKEINRISSLIKDDVHSC